jgi:hypothetical protein
MVARDPWDFTILPNEKHSPQIHYPSNMCNAVARTRAVMHLHILISITDTESVKVQINVKSSLVSQYSRRILSKTRSERESKRGDCISGYDGNICLKYNF